MKTLILDYMEATAARLPEKTAFADENSSVTFSALVARAKAVASALCGYVPPRSVIGFYMDKGVDTAIGFMGAVYAGCAYSLLNLRDAGNAGYADCRNGQGASFPAGDA